MPLDNFDCHDGAIYTLALYLNEKSRKVSIAIVIIMIMIIYQYYQDNIYGALALQGLVEGTWQERVRFLLAATRTG